MTHRLKGGSSKLGPFAVILIVPVRLSASHTMLLW